MAEEVDQLPSKLTVAKFVACRSQEILMMKNCLAAQSGTKLAFQTLPKHMRRRAMSHNAKRLPRRLRQIHLNQRKKSGLPTKQKRPSRKYRRRPRILTEEYTKRANKKYRWLNTHIWHAKRFHMIEKWGYKLPYRPCDKAFRACYRAMSQHCLIQDISYFNCIEITGDRNLIIENIKQLWRPGTGLSIGAKAFIQGNREGEFTAYEIGDSGKAIGNVKFQWCPNRYVTKLWLWVHNAFYEQVKDAVVRFSDIVVQELGTELSRFKLTGPLVNAVLHDALVTDNVQSDSYLKEYFADKQVLDYWKYIGNVTSVTSISPHLIIGLIVNDPRLYIPKKRSKSVPELNNLEYCDPPNNLADSPLWYENIRKQSNCNKVPDSEINDLRSKMLVPDVDLSSYATQIPIILIQRPGKKTDNIGLGSGWDVIVPSTWAKTFWIAFVMRGARAGGLRESESILFEMGQSQFLQPDTKAGSQEDLQVSKNRTAEFFRKPPNKRINYNKFKIVSPFTFNWKLLLKEWNSDFCYENFPVIKDKLILKSIEIFLNSKAQLLPEFPKSSLIPVQIQCEKRGSPSKFAIICIPKCKKDFVDVTEPQSEDKFQMERKQTRKAHQSLLKKFKKQRKSKSIDLEVYHDALNNYTAKMRSLWLPEATSIRNSCSREVIGFVTMGGFSFALGKSSATGYIASDCLPALNEFRNEVLFRNTNSKQYYVAKLSVIIE